MASTNCSANNLHEDIQTTREKHGRSVYWSQRRWSGGACPCPSRPHPMGDWGERHDACCLLIDPRKLQSEIRFFFSRTESVTQRLLRAAGARCHGPPHGTRRPRATRHGHICICSTARSPARRASASDGRRGHTWFLRCYLASAGSIASPVRTDYSVRGSWRGWTWSC